MLAMLPVLQFIVHHFLIIALILWVIVMVVVSIVRGPVSPKKAANWPVTEATIQSVGTVVVNAGRSSYTRSYTLDVGDFSYKVNDDYYSGRLKISRSFSTGDHSPKELIDKKIQVRYNPQKPEKFFVPQQELVGFLLDPYDEGLGGQDIDPLDLNLDKI